MGLSRVTVICCIVTLYAQVDEQGTEIWWDCPLLLLQYMLYSTLCAQVDEQEAEIWILRVQL